MAPSRKTPRGRAKPIEAEGSDEPPKFTVAHMDRSVDPRVDFYRYAAGTWLKTHPVPSDKSRWAGFDELAEHNYRAVRGILEAMADPRTAPEEAAGRLVGDFYASGMDQGRRDQLRFEPILEKIERIRAIATVPQLIERIAALHAEGIDTVFRPAVLPDEKASQTYALYLWQGGLALPDRDYYLEASFEKVRAAYLSHVAAMFRGLGRSATAAKAAARTVLDLETALAKASRSRVALRDPLKNYHRVAPEELARSYRTLDAPSYLAHRGFRPIEYAIVGQPEFLKAADRLLKQRPLAAWRTYLEWCVLHDAAPYLHGTAEAEDFRFFHKVLLGTKAPEPRWRRVAREVDASIGEALGQLYVARFFPPEAKARMGELVDDVRAVFRERLEGLPWMAPATRARALEKFDRFTAKIGHPEVFRDYRAVGVDRADYYGNVRRAAAFEIRRKRDRVGQAVDRSEWLMTPPTVNAYFEATQNEIVFPAGILQPFFFDPTMDDAVNYGSIGTVIGHEITHGYDDQGRRYDADGNLNDWWTAGDAREFERRAKAIVAQYNAYEPLPGAHVNGELTQGENIADFGGVSLAFEALQRRLSKDPSRRRSVDGFTPEQRFFLAYAQTWRGNIREPELRRRLTIDPHAPSPFRAVGPLVNFPAFHAAFDVRPGDPMYRAPSERVEIW